MSSDPSLAIDWVILWAPRALFASIDEMTFFKLRTTVLSGMNDTVDPIRHDPREFILGQSVGIRASDLILCSKYLCFLFFNTFLGMEIL